MEGGPFDGLSEKDDRYLKCLVSWWVYFSLVSRATFSTLKERTDLVIGWRATTPTGPSGPSRGAIMSVTRFLIGMNPGVC
jgi:hypothetical protein